ncbi:MAG: LptF/LptG family permease [Myxococcales bacterium]|jgi:lipopolysaccharide export system permease protein|nr:LptF/LptG family permease [Myxococcales bacterium]
MHRIDRYLFGEILSPFLSALAFLFTLLFAMQMLRGIEVMLGASVAATDLLYVAVCLVPHFVVMAVPISFLFALIIGFGRLADDREILALKASGVSPSRLWIAPVSLAALLSAIGIAFGYGPEPVGLANLDRHIDELIKKNMVGDVKPGVFYDALRGITLYAQEVDPDSRRFTNVLLVDERSPKDSTLWLAQSGHVDPHGRGASLLLLLSDGELYRASERDAGERAASAIAAFERCTLNIQAKDLLRKNRFGATRREAMVPSQLAAYAQHLRAEAASLRAEAEESHASLAIDDAPALPAETVAVDDVDTVDTVDKSRPEGSLHERALALQAAHKARRGDHLKQARSKEKEARRLDVVRARRLAAPLASIVFAMCAVPLAMGRRQRGQGLGIMASLACYVGYYTLTRLGEGMGESGALPAMLAAQIPNLVFLALGLFLVRRSQRVM